MRESVFGRRLAAQLEAPRESEEERAEPPAAPLGQPASRTASRQATTHTWLVCTAAHTLSRSPSVTERTDAAGSWLELGLRFGATRRDSGTGDESGAAGSKTSMAPFRIRLTGAERRAQGKGDACQEVGLSRASATVCLCGVLARLSLR